MYLDYSFFKNHTIVLENDLVHRPKGSSHWLSKMCLQQRDFDMNHDWSLFHGKFEILSTIKRNYWTCNVKGPGTHSC